MHTQFSGKSREKFLLVLPKIRDLSKQQSLKAHTAFFFSRAGNVPFQKKIQESILIERRRKNMTFPSKNQSRQNPTWHLFKISASVLRNNELTSYTRRCHQSWKYRNSRNSQWQWNWLMSIIRPHYKSSGWWIGLLMRRQRHTIGNVRDMVCDM